MAHLISKNVPRYGIGIAAMAVAAYCMFSSWPQDQTIFFVSSLLLLICATDTFYTKIPNLANLTMVLAGLVYHCHATGFNGFLFAFAGLALGFALLLVPYLLGGMGAGDVKALAALGAVLGPGAIFQVFLYMSIAGGILALLHFVMANNLRKKGAEWLAALTAFICCRDPRCLKPSDGGEKLRFPYAAAIAFGFFAHVTWGSILYQ